MDAPSLPGNVIMLTAPVTCWLYINASDSYPQMHFLLGPHLITLNLASSLVKELVAEAGS